MKEKISIKIKNQ